MPPSSPLNLLLVEDDPAIGRSVCKGFEESGHSCHWVKSGKRGLEEALTLKYDCVILDLLLPEMSGTEVLSKLRAAGSTAVVVLTALGSTDDRVAGLNRGADDYLVKPFDFVELMARVSAVCRRSLQKPAMHMEWGDLDLDLTNRKVTRKGKEIDLTPTEFSILELLMRHEGQTVTRRMLCEHLWESYWEGTTNVIEVHMNRLRNKVDFDDGESIILTVRGRGYALRNPA